MTPLRRTGRIGQRLTLGLTLSVALHLGVVLGLRPVAVSSVLPQKPVAATARVIHVAANDSPTPAMQSGAFAASPRPSPLTPAPVLPAWEPRVQVEFADSDYVVARQLSQRPAAMGSVIVAYPTDVVGENKVTRVILTLFINERGTVDRVRVDDADVPTPFADAARNAFSAATFDPGRIEDQPVKSRMRVEVEFTLTEPKQ
jgi:hypothetical protein